MCPPVTQLTWSSPLVNLLTINANYYIFEMRHANRQDLVCASHALIVVDDMFPLTSGQE